MLTTLGKLKNDLYRRKQDILRELAFQKMNALINKGLAEGKITPFDASFYNQMSNIFFAGLPVSIHIKYLKPMKGMPGGCYDRSLYMFFCFPNALLVRGNNKDLELKYGKEHSGHGWIEIDDFVYDPTSMMRFDRELYYSIYSPTNVIKCTKEEYCSFEGNQELYDDITSTTIEDLQPFGRKRIELITEIPLVKGIAEMSGNQDFINDLNKHLITIQYDEQQISDELNSKIKDITNNSRSSNTL